jgi:acyl carrier protein
MDEDASFDTLIEIIRECQGFSAHDEIYPDMLLEQDLGISGDDGCELLNAIEQTFGISFLGADGTLKETFKLAEGEYLFHSEGFSLFGFIATLLGKDVEKVKPLTVGQLHEAVLASKLRNNNQITKGNT